MSAEAGRPVADLGPALSAADILAAIHVADDDGRCQWCWNELGIWTPHPCTASRWAERTYIIIRNTEEATT